MSSRSRLLPRDAPAVLTAFAALAVCIAFGRFSLGLLLPDMRRSLELSYSAMGALASVNLLGYLAGVAVVPYLSRRTSHLRLAQAGILGAAAGMLVTALPVSTPVLFAAVLSTGIAGALGWVSSAAVGVGVSSPENRGRILGLIGTANGVGIVVASALAVTLSTDGVIDWRKVWMIQASLGALAVLLSYSVRRAEALPAPDPVPVTAPSTSLLSLHVGYGCFGVGYTWFATYFVASIQAGTGRAGADAWLLVGFGACVGALTFGALGDRHGHARTLATSQGLAALACVMMVGFDRSAVAAAIAGLSFGAVLTAMASLVPAVVAHSVGAEATPAAFARLTLTFGVVQVFAPASGGLVVDASRGSFAILYLGAALLFALAAVAFARSTYDGGPHPAL